MTTTKPAYPFVTGDRLPNGAVLIHATLKRSPFGEEQWVVLARFHDEPFSWVVWTSSPTGDTYWGHYHATLKEAVATFDEMAE